MCPNALSPGQAFSAATLGRTWLRAMGIRPILERQPDFPREILGASMLAYVGGRAEARIRRIPVPIVYLDFLSMYPTVCILLKLWPLLICETIEVQDATEEVQQMVNRVSLEDCLRQETWPTCTGFVQFVPRGDIVPHRSSFGEDAQWQIGVNPWWLDEPNWYTIPDAIASTLLTGRAPRVTRAFRLVPRGTSSSLRSVSLRGGKVIDPRMDDFFKVIIEERKRVATRLDLSEAERRRLDRFLKVLATATSYGIFVEMRRRELISGRRERVKVFGLDPSPFIAEISSPEDSGEYTFPPFGALIAGAARLMLAVLERLITDEGGIYAFCDTDSMAPVATVDGGLVPCPGGMERMADSNAAIRALSWADVERIRERFASLNPYDPSAVPGSILKLEDVNFDPASNQRRKLYCFPISSKRYALCRFGPDGRPILQDHHPDGKVKPIKHSEHGLGHLLNPTDPDDEDRGWITTIWEGIITEAVGLPYTWPHWLERPAASRLNISTWRQYQLFDAMNRGKSYQDQIKPGNFLLSFHVAPFGHPTGIDPERFHLLAPWNSNPRQWLKSICFDSYSGKMYRITTRGQAGSDGVARVKTYGDVLSEYRVHPETKSLGPDGMPCGRATVGLLRRRSATGIYIDYVGKESNRLEDVLAGLVHHRDEVMISIPAPSGGYWPKLVLPVLREAPVTSIANACKASVATIKRIRLGAKPSATLIGNLIKAAGEFARTRLESWSQTPPKDDLAACYAYLAYRRRLKMTGAKSELE